MPCVAGAVALDQQGVVAGDCDDDQERKYANENPQQYHSIPPYGVAMIIGKIEGLSTGSTEH